MISMRTRRSPTACAATNSCWLWKVETEAHVRGTGDCLHGGEAPIHKNSKNTAAHRLPKRLEPGWHRKQKYNCFIFDNDGYELA